MNLVNTLTAPGHRSGDNSNTNTAYALVLCNDSICIYNAPRPWKDYNLPTDHFDRKYALVARYPINLFRVGPVEIYVRSQNEHPNHFYGAYVVRKPS